MFESPKRHHPVQSILQQLLQMEDVLPMALVRPSDPSETGNLATLRQAGSDIAALAGAAEAVVRRGPWQRMSEGRRKAPNGFKRTAHLGGF